MQKLELWEQNEPLFADKLNNEVKTVNAIIDKLNTQPPNSSGGAMGSITYPQFYSTQRELLQMWNADGEGVVLSGHDFGFVGDSGLYARKNEVVMNGQRFIPNDRSLKKIADYSCLQDGGILYQEIITYNGIICDASLKYTNNDLPDDTENYIYRKLSRIVTDCKHYACGGKRRFKAIAVNETRFNHGNNSGGGGEIIYQDGMQGMVTTANEHKTWEELKVPQNVLYLFDLNSGLRTYITAQNCNGFIKLNTKLTANC